MLRLVAPLLLLLAAPALAQSTQTVRGTVLDADSRAPLPGATVTVLHSDPLIGAASDADGRFALARVPLGRHTLEVRFLGYATRRVPNVLVRAGHETVLEIALTEQPLEGEGVVVQAEAREGRALDDMATVSARSFSVEEARRYAGAVDDPARLAAAFAGVATSGSGVQDNALAIRGNAPKGVGWRLEGVPIPTPSHFAGLTVAGGGGLTLFSGRLLADSDAFTGAFPAEYGDALAGVFDMRFRTGNPSTREHAVQLGVIGLEVASEGPIRAGSDATYLANYRYSTLGLLLPLLPTEGGITYQDLAFKVAVPTRRAGRFEVWGLGGLDAQTQPENRDSTTWEYEQWDRMRTALDLGVGAGGVSHHLVLGSRTYLRSTDARPVLGCTVHHKWNARHRLRAGVLAQRLLYDLDLHSAPGEGAPLAPLAESAGASTLVEAFAQSRVTPAQGVDLTAGLHAQHLALTGATAIEPRAGLRLALSDRQSVTLGYGLHSQTEPLRL
ncbi:MAG TPA: carboxypeptidase-like regulatory domain-containing protein, partial [Rhodothermales bacterium]|nr:carboxypeptidase-like regulatory domain-containing protein [Rhodothermales bacterium]